MWKSHTKYEVNRTVRFGEDEDKLCSGSGWASHIVTHCARMKLAWNDFQKWRNLSMFFQSQIMIMTKPVRMIDVHETVMPKFFQSSCDIGF